MPILTDKDKIAALEQELRELKAVVYAYDKAINQLPKDELVRFAHLTPPEFLEGMRLLTHVP